MYIFVEYPKCSTCQRARKWLEGQGVEFTSRHILEENPTREELAAWAEKLPLKRLWNTSGQKYRQLGLAQRLPGMSQEEQLALLATDGMLVKRPVLLGEALCSLAEGNASLEVAFGILETCLTSCSLSLLPVCASNVIGQGS